MQSLAVTVPSKSMTARTRRNAAGPAPKVSLAFIVIILLRGAAGLSSQRETPLRRALPDYLPAAVVADRSLAACEWLVREAGAVHFLLSTRQLPPLARLVVRHLANVPAPQQTLVDRIWASLPWPGRAT